MKEAPNFALALIADRRALGWVLEEQMVAFPDRRFGGQDPPFHEGDSIYLYTTRGCFKNPTRDRSRIIGKAIATSNLRVNAKPVTFGDRAYPLEVPVRIESLAPFGEGIDFAAQVPTMTTFPKPDAWTAYMRRAFVILSRADAKRFDKLLKPHEGQLAANIAAYQQRARMGER